MIKYIYLPRAPELRKMCAVLPVFLVAEGESVWFSISYGFNGRYLRCFMTQETSVFNVIGCEEMYRICIREHGVWLHLGLLCFLMDKGKEGEEEKYEEQEEEKEVEEEE